MFTLLIVLIILVCILLSLVVLAQSSKGDGLAAGLGAPGSVGAVFGVRRASDFLTKATIVLAGVFMLFAMIANLFFLPGSGSAPSAVQSGPEPVTRTMPGGSVPVVPQSQPAAPAK